MVSIKLAHHPFKVLAGWIITLQQLENSLDMFIWELFNPNIEIDRRFTQLNGKRFDRTPERA